MLLYKTTGEIMDRIAEVEHQLRIIEDALAREMTKPYWQRRIGIFRFLDVEKKIFTAKLDELRWFIQD